MNSCQRCKLGYQLDETNFRAIFTRQINVLHKGTAASKEFLIHLSQDSNFLTINNTSQEKFLRVFERLDLTCQEK